MEQQDLLVKNAQEKDVDLGSTFIILQRIVESIQKVFSSLLDFGLLMLIFLKKRILWVVLSLVLGYGAGMFLNKSLSKNYASVLYARFNFESGFSLYNTIDHINGLIGEGDVAALSKLFNISEKDAASLVGLSATPVKDELYVRKLYQETYLKPLEDQENRTDSFWSKTVLPYKDFRNALNYAQYPVQEVTVVSNTNIHFSQLQKALLNEINNEVLEKRKVASINLLNEEANSLLNSLYHIDSLQSLTNLKLKNSSGKDDGGYKLNIINNPSSKKVNTDNLYNTAKSLSLDLKKVRQEMMDQKEIVEVLSPLYDGGKLLVQEKKHSPFSYALKGLLCMLAILALIEMFQYLTIVEKNQPTAKV